MEDFNFDIHAEIERLETQSDDWNELDCNANTDNAGDPQDKASPPYYHF